MAIAVFSHLLTVDGFEAYFPSVYKDYLAIDEATGSINVSWEADDKLLTVRSNIIRAKLDAGSSNIMFSAQQTIPSGATSGCQPVDWCAQSRCSEAQ